MYHSNEPNTDDLDDRELPDPSDMDPDDSDDFDNTTPCPHCKNIIDEHAQFCHHCGKYISREDSPPKTALWVTLAAITCIIVIVCLWLIR